MVVPGHALVAPPWSNGRPMVISNQLGSVHDMIQRETKIMNLSFSLYQKKTLITVVTFKNDPSAISETVMA